MSYRLFVAGVGVYLGCALSVQAQDGGNPFPPVQAPPMQAPLMPGPQAMGAPDSSPGMPNPYLAQLVVQRLQESGQLARYRINVHANGGVVDLVGEIADESQRDVVLRILRTVPGIVSVRDFMQSRQEGNIVAAQAPLVQGPLAQPFPPLNGMQKPPERIDGQLPEPMPIFQAPPGPNPAMQPPPMPPYAWPTVAPYNNYSRVAYPNAYPYEQFPFIGPMYPFPRVPLGWRSVSLTWDDGHWWFHRNPTGHDWWRVRYH